MQTGTPSLFSIMRVVIDRVQEDLKITNVVQQSTRSMLDAVCQQHTDPNNLIRLEAYPLPTVGDEQEADVPYSPCCSANAAEEDADGEGAEWPTGNEELTFTCSECGKKFTCQKVYTPRYITKLV